MTRILSSSTGLFCAKEKGAPSAEGKVAGHPKHLVAPELPRRIVPGRGRKEGDRRKTGGRQEEEKEEEKRTKKRRIEYKLKKKEWGTHAQARSPSLPSTQFL